MVILDASRTLRKLLPDSRLFFRSKSGSADGRGKCAAMIVADLLTGKRVSRAHIQEMDDPIPTKFAGFLISVSAAAMAAFTVGYVAHYDLGLSRLDIRTLALIGAAIIALLLATEYFGKMLRKTK